MPKRDPRITKYIQERAPFARPILRHLRKVIHEGAPGLEESIKWGMPSFLHQGKIVCGFAGFKAHCALWFWQGRVVVGRKPAEAMGNFGRIASVDDLPSATAIRRYVRKAVALISPV
ncbi:MAG: DUF1801 domain-containing protein [Steroidobacteraceae bacterium]